MSDNLFEGAPVTAEAVETPAPKKPGRPKKADTAESDAHEPLEPLEPLVAECKITYGKHATALPGDFFTPSSAAEREYLLNIDAARELNDAETALFEKLNG